MNKKNIFIIGFLIVFFTTAFLQYRNSLPIKNQVTVSYISVKQIVLIDETKNQTQLRIKKGATALEVLSAHYTIISKGKNENAFITSIDGRLASPEKREFWAFYINGKQATVGAGSYKIKNNDTIEWKIETY